MRWSRQSREYLIASRERVRGDNGAVAAERMRLRMRKMVMVLGAMPGLDIRVVGTVSPYIIVYRTISCSLVVLGIFHGRRQQ